MHLKRKSQEALVSEQEQYRCPRSSIERPASKKQRTTRDTIWVPPAAFWDQLSTIPLTKSALREFDHRLAKELHSRPVRRTETPWQRQTSILNSRNLPGYCPPRLARHGGFDLTDLRGNANPFVPGNSQMPPRASRSRQHSSYSHSANEAGSTTQTTTTSKSTRPYDRAFQQHLIDHHIFPPEYTHPDGRELPEPGNLTEIRERLGQYRRSLSPTRFRSEDFKRFVRADATASKENKVLAKVLTTIEGNDDDSRSQSGGIKFSNLKALTDGTICPGNPDNYHGARPEAIRLEVRKALDGFILPSTQLDLPAVPNFMLAAKGPDGSFSVASRQAVYDGALGARGVLALQQYASKDKHKFDGNAYCISSIYHAGILRMFTSHPVAPDSSDDLPTYVLSQIDIWAMSGNVESFRQGARAYRNLRDWAKEQRDKFIREANAEASIDKSVEVSQSMVREETGTESLQTEHLTEEDASSDTHTETLSSFAVLGASEALGSEDGEHRNSQNMSLKHPSSPPRDGKSKRGRQKLTD